MSNKWEVWTTKRTEELGDMFGVFFEDINHAADGGLYGELIQNRSFEFSPVDNKDYDALTGWEKVTGSGIISLNIEDEEPVNWMNPHYLVMEVKKPGKDLGIMNLGFGGGIPISEGASYRFSCHAKREKDFDRCIWVSLRNSDGSVYEKQSVKLSRDWTKYEFYFMPEVTDPNARLYITVEGEGRVFIDFVSLFPTDTFNNRKNGMRKDIAKLIADMQPKFMRFPGGCLTHDGSLNADDRDSLYRWKNTLGGLEGRPARRNNWGYNQTLGLGYYEYFCFCEDIGAKPIPVLPGGCDPHHQRFAPMDEMQEWIDDALDLIEFANGDRYTKWGGIRAAMGHIEPFHLEYIAIGNEEVGEAFFERYPLFHQAIKEKYPDIKIINTASPFAAGGEYERGWESARENHSDLVDEHYYMSPEWFIANNHRYDDFKKEDPKVFLGEYATWGNTWYNALVEASYMVGLEINAGKVALACYAPMLCNVDYVNWKPDMIWFNNHEAYGTPNYYVQSLFMKYQGDSLLENTITFSEEPRDIMPGKARLSGKIALDYKDADVEYSDIVIVNEETGEEIRPENVTVNAENRNVTLADLHSGKYTIRMKAKELTGTKGFFLEFNKKDEKNRMFWELGAWQNLDMAVSEDINGRGSCLAQYTFSVEQGRVYELELRVDGRNIQTFVDGVQYHDINLKPVIVEPLYTSASAKNDGSIILKVVNISDSVKELDVHLHGMGGKTNMGRMIRMAGYKLEDENSFEEPEKVTPKVTGIVSEAGDIILDVPAHSVSIIVINKEESYTVPA